MAEGAARDFIAHVARVYERGIICPAEMWFQVEQHLTHVGMRRPENPLIHFQAPLKQFPRFIEPISPCRDPRQAL